MYNRNFMRIAINLAKKNIGNTGINPSVACLIEKDNHIIGIGLTGESGRPHAEYNAMSKCKDQIKGSTVYVTMEPCSHEGATPSCARILAEAGVAKVVSPIMDPNPVVNGKGFEILKNSGVEVFIDKEHNEKAKRIIEGFSKKILTGKPFVTLKLASSLDGKIALNSGKSKWISGIESRRKTQLLRYRNDAIMVGSKTFIEDNPELSIRENFGRNNQPIRVLLSSDCKILPKGKIFDTLKSQKTIIFTGYKGKKNWPDWEKAGANLIQVKSTKNSLDLNAVLYQLGSMGISNLLVEGGANLSASLLNENLLDRIIIFYSGRIFGSSGISGISKLKGEKVFIEDYPHFFIEETRKYGNDLMVSWIKKSDNLESG